GSLAKSLARQDRIFRSTLILNPVENLPFPEDISPASGFLHGLYNTDKIRSPEQQKNTLIQFAGRQRISHDVRQIYEAWVKALGAADISMRLMTRHGTECPADIFRPICQISPIFTSSPRGRYS